MNKKYLIFDLDGTLISNMNSILEYLVEYLYTNFSLDKENTKYILVSTSWTPLKKQLEMLLPDLPKNDLILLTDKLYSWLEKIDWEFFPWVVEKITELSKKYKLFLTTWNSTTTANHHLLKWWIQKYFELIYWSDVILKWPEHINIFIDYSNDKDFIKKSVYIWDWVNDRNISNYFWIDFIHIWNEKIDKYEINSVSQIDTILEKIN